MYIHLKTVLDVYSCIKTILSFFSYFPQSNLLLKNMFNADYYFIIFYYFHDINRSLARCIIHKLRTFHRSLYTTHLTHHHSLWFCFCWTQVLNVFGFCRRSTVRVTGTLVMSFFPAVLRGTSGNSGLRRVLAGVEMSVLSVAFNGVQMSGPLCARCYMHVLTCTAGNCVRRDVYLMGRWPWTWKQKKKLGSRDGGLEGRGSYNPFLASHVKWKISERSL